METLYDEEVTDPKQADENINLTSTTQSDEQQVKGEIQDAKKALNIKLTDSDTIPSLTPIQLNSPSSPTAATAAQTFNQGESQQKNGSNLKQQPRRQSQGQFCLSYR